MSASFCDCVNQWEQAVGLQVLKDTKYLSLRTRGGLAAELVISFSHWRLCLLCHCRPDKGLIQDNSWNRFWSIKIASSCIFRGHHSLTGTHILILPWESPLSSEGSCLMLYQQFSEVFTPLHLNIFLVQLGVWEIICRGWRRGSLLYYVDNLNLILKM